MSLALPSDGSPQAARDLLAGIGVPGTWAGQPCWRVLATQFGHGLAFLAAWHAWRSDPSRPRQLHFVAFGLDAADPPAALSPSQLDTATAPLAAQLQRACWGLTPGVHRLAFEDGRVALTLCVGEAALLLREQSMQADAVLLQGRPDAWPLPLLKAVARLCRPGAAMASDAIDARLSHDLRTCGFAVREGTSAGRFQPPWRVAAAPSLQPSQAIVVGAGLAGAAAASALARRGWQVQVLDSATIPAAGASALPAGLLAPHQSPDDNVLSRLSRAGVRTTLQEAARLLQAPRDWAPVPVLEQRGVDARAVPEVPGLAAWTRPATALEVRRAGGPGAGAVAWWHERAAWIRPSALVRAWLAEPGVAFRGGVRIERVASEEAGWSLFDGAGHQVARAPLVVLAAAGGTVGLAAGRVALQPVRGQVTWGLRTAVAGSLPPHPVNGAGHFLPLVSFPEGEAWLTGSTYGRGDADASIRQADVAANLERLRGLVPEAAVALAPAFERGEVLAWAGVRYVAADRRPLLGELAPGLWASTAMGSRGLTFAPLCAELLAARLHGEPLPVEQRLARALAADRPLRRS